MKSPAKPKSHQFPTIWLKFRFPVGRLTGTKVVIELCCIFGITFFCWEEGVFREEKQPTLVLQEICMSILPLSRAWCMNYQRQMRIWNYQIVWLNNYAIKQINLYSSSEIFTSSAAFSGVLSLRTMYNSQERCRNNVLRVFGVCMCVLGNVYRGSALESGQSSISDRYGTSIHFRSDIGQDVACRRFTSFINDHEPKSLETADPANREGRLILF